MLRYYGNFIIYGLKEYDAEGFLKIIETYKHSFISGDGTVLDELEPYIPAEKYEKKDTYFAECTKLPVKCSVDETLIENVKVANVEDARRIAELENQIEEFTQLSLTPISEREREIQKKLKSKAGRSYYIEEKGKIVSIVSTSAENTVSAMIIGVCTAPNYRKRGYVSAILPKLMEDLLKEKETLCLFYENPEAGNIYKRNGFKDIGIWRMYIKSN